MILLTGHATVEKGIEAMKLGAMDLIEKPVDISTLTDKIKNAHTQKTDILANFFQPLNTFFVTKNNHRFFSNLASTRQAF